jgi:hypothetical protein
VNEAFVRAYFPNVNPLGQRFGFDTDETAARAAAKDPKYHRDPGDVIIGVVHDSKYNDLRSDVKPTMYVPSDDGGTFELRTAGNPLAVVSAVREILRQAGGNMPIFDMETESKQIDDLLFQERLIARMSRCSHCCLLVLDSSVCFRTNSRSARRKSASGWRWEHRRETSCEMSSGMGYYLPSSARPLARQYRSP